MVCITASVTLETVVHPTVRNVSISRRLLCALDLVNGLGLRSIHSFFCHLDCIFRFSSDVNSTGKFEFIVLNRLRAFKTASLSKEQIKCVRSASSKELRKHTLQNHDEFALPIPE